MKKEKGNKVPRDEGITTAIKRKSNLSVKILKNNPTQSEQKQWKNDADVHRVTGSRLGPHPLWERRQHKGRQECSLEFGRRIKAAKGRNNLIRKKEPKIDRPSLIYKKK